MDIVYDQSLLTGNFFKTADIHILTDGRDHRSQLFFHCLGGVLRPSLFHKRFEISRTGLVHLCRHRTDEILELLILCHEIRLAVYFYHSSLLSICADVSLYDTLCRDPACFFLRFRQAVLSQVLHRFIHIAVCICKRFLTIHHASARHFS